MKNIKIAVTGGIGSGKSTVINIIEKLGYKTISLDKVYNDLLNEGHFVEEISKMFEIKPIYDGERAILDKNALSEKVFNDKIQLKKLNNFTHTKIFEKAFSICNDNIVFYEVPLLFEGNYQNLFNRVIVVMRSKDKRIKSSAKRDNCPEKKIEDKIKNQIDYENYDFSLHTIIQNDGDINSLEKRVIEVVKEINGEIF